MKRCMQCIHQPAKWTRCWSGSSKLNHMPCARMKLDLEEEWNVEREGNQCALLYAGKITALFGKSVKISPSWKVQVWVYVPICLDFTSRGLVQVHLSGTMRSYQPWHHFSLPGCQKWKLQDIRWGISSQKRPRSNITLLSQWGLCFVDRESSSGRFLGSEIPQRYMQELGAYLLLDINKI